MKTFLLVTGLVALASLLIFVLFVCFCLFIRWIAKGESDVNGDPERDGAGMDQLPKPATAAEIKYVCGYCPPEKNFIRGNPNGIESHGCCDFHREALARAEAEGA